MRDRWIEATLGDVFEPTNTRLGDVDVEPAVFSVTKYDGFVLASQYFDKRIASDNLGTYKVVEPGEWAYSTIHIDEGSIARNRHGIRGVVSPMYTTMRVRDDAPVMPYFVELIARSPRMLAAYRDNAQGSINRRRSLPWKVFQAMPISLPPLQEQRRIVDLVGAADEAIEKAEVVVARTRQLPPHLMAHALEERSVGLHRLGDVGQFVRGKRFTKADYVDAGLGCIHYGHLYTGLGPVSTETLAYVPESMTAKLRLATPGDVVLAATSENVEDLGKATAWLGTSPVAVHDDCYIFKHSMNPVFASYLFTTPQFLRQRDKYAAGLKVMRLSGDSLSRIEMPMIDREAQDGIADLLVSANAQLRAASTAAARLRVLRSNLLSALLSGEHEVPESYDELMEETP